MVSWYFIRLLVAHIFTIMEAGYGTVRPPDDKMAFYGMRICNGRNEEKFQKDDVFSHLSKYSVTMDVLELITSYHKVRHPKEESISLMGRFLKSENNIRSTFQTKSLEAKTIQDVDDLISNVPHTFAITDDSFVLLPTCQSSNFYDLYGVLFTTFMLLHTDATLLPNGICFVDSVASKTDEENDYGSKLWKEYVPDGEHYVGDEAYGRIRHFQHQLDTFEDFSLKDPRNNKGSYRKNICIDTLRLDTNDSEDITYMGMSIEYNKKKDDDKNWSILKCKSPNLERPFAKSVIGYHIDVERYWACVEEYLDTHLWHIETYYDFATLQERIEYESKSIKDGLLCQRRYNLRCMMHFDKLFNTMGGRYIAYKKRSTTSLKKIHPNYYSCITLYPDVGDDRINLPYEVLMGFNVLGVNEKDGGMFGVDEELVKQTSKRLLLNYANVGINCLNGLRKYTDAFRWVYGFKSVQSHDIKGNQLDGSGRISFYHPTSMMRTETGRNTGSIEFARTPLVLVESLVGYESLSQRIHNHCLQTDLKEKDKITYEKMMTDVFAQVSNAINMAGKFFEFTHGQLTADNIYVRELKSPKKIKIYGYPEFSVFYDRHSDLCWKAFKYWYKNAEAEDDVDDDDDTEIFKKNIMRDIFTSLVNRNNPTKTFYSGYTEMDVMWDIKIDGFEHASYKINGFKVPMTIRTDSENKPSNNTVWIPVNVNETLMKAPEWELHKPDRKIKIDTTFNNTKDKPPFTLHHLSKAYNTSFRYSILIEAKIKNKKIDSNVFMSDVYTNFNVSGFTMTGEDAISPENHTPNTLLSQASYNTKSTRISLAKVVNRVISDNEKHTITLWTWLKKNLYRNKTIMSPEIPDTNPPIELLRKIIVLACLFDEYIGSILMSSMREIPKNAPKSLLAVKIELTFLLGQPDVVEDDFFYTRFRYSKITTKSTNFQTHIYHELDDIDDVIELLKKEDVYLGCMSTDAKNFFTRNQAVDRNVIWNPYDETDKALISFGYFDPVEDLYTLSLDVFEYTRMNIMVKQNMSVNNLSRITDIVVGSKYGDKKTNSLNNMIQLMLQDDVDSAWEKHETPSVIKNLFHFIITGKTLRHDVKKQHRERKQDRAWQLSVAKYDEYKLAIYLSNLALSEALKEPTLRSMIEPTRTIQPATNISYDTDSNYDGKDVSILFKDSSKFQEAKKAIDSDTGFITNLEYQRYFFNGTQMRPETTLFKYGKYSNDTNTLHNIFAKRSLCLPFCARGGRCNADAWCDTFANDSEKRYSVTYTDEKPLPFPPMNESKGEYEKENLLLEFKNITNLLNNPLSDNSYDKEGTEMLHKSGSVFFLLIAEKIHRFIQLYHILRPHMKDHLPSSLENVTQNIISLAHNTEYIEQWLVDYLGYNHTPKTAKKKIIQNIEETCVFHWKAYYRFDGKQKTLNIPNFHLHTSYITPYPNKDCELYLDFVYATRLLRRLYVSEFQRDVTFSTFKTLQTIQTFEDKQKSIDKRKRALKEIRKEVETQKKENERLEREKRERERERLEREKRERKAQIESKNRLAQENGEKERKAQETAKNLQTAAEKPTNQITPQKMELLKKIQAEQIKGQNQPKSGYIPPNPQYIQDPNPKPAIVLRFEGLNETNQTSADLKELLTSIRKIKNNANSVRFDGESIPWPKKIQVFWPAETFPKTLFSTELGISDDIVKFERRETPDNDEVKANVLIYEAGNESKVIMDKIDGDVYVLKITYNLNDLDFNTDTRNFVYPAIRKVSKFGFDMFSVWGFLFLSHTIANASDEKKIDIAKMELKKMNESINAINGSTN